MKKILVKKIVKPKYAEKPWITKGILKACKKKNSLYKEFLRKRTTEAEQKYKTYKNKQKTNYETQQNGSL